MIEVRRQIDLKKWQVYLICFSSVYNGVGSVA
jgi:hypothetical protein